jgi:signal transduction histidine kinase/CheY-like chemotaxis protein
MQGDKSKAAHGAGRWHRSNWVIVVVVVLVGFAASLAGFFGARDSAHDSNGQLVREDAAQGALLIGTEAQQITTPYVDLGKVVGPGMAPATFAAAATPAVGLGASITLLHESAGAFHVVATAGPPARPLGAGSVPSVSALAAQPGAHFLGAYVAGGERWVQEVFGQGYVPAGFVMYAAQPVGHADAITSLPGVFDNIDAAVYAGSIKPANLIFRTSAGLPSGNQMGVAVVPVPSSELTSSTVTAQPATIEEPGELIVAMSSTANLSGAYAANFPWMILLIGSMLTLLLTWLVIVAVRRRDEALGLVNDLKGKNSELDTALTRQAQAEQSLHQVQRMEAVGQLAGGIAHDFNNLLQVIISYSGFISEAIDADSEAQRDVAEVQKAAQRAAELTRQLLVFSRQDVARPTVLDLNAVVMKAERLLRHALGEDVHLRCEMAPAPAYVLADPGELDQMLMNLSINARDAMPRGGELAIVVDTVEIGAGAGVGVGVGAALGAADGAADLAPGRYARIEVKDEGEGMTPEVAAKAFEPFFTTKETGRGTGLGLAMVFGIVTRLGGRVSISTAVGLGTTFTLLFPFSAEVPDLSADAPEGQPAQAGREVVLLVEDEEGVRRSTTRILEWAGYRVLSAENTVQALGIFHSAEVEVDILVTDLIMPGGVSGNELADWLREEVPDLPVVLITGYSAEAITERGIIPMRAALIKKPFPPEELLEAVALAVSERAVMVSP